MTTNERWRAWQRDQMCKLSRRERRALRTGNLARLFG